MKEFLISLLNFFGLAAWIEIVTDDPNCTYYFGPFLNNQEAKIEQKGYVEDLESEGARVIQVEIKHCKPSRLTISSQEETTADKVILPRLSAQS